MTSIDCGGCAPPVMIETERQRDQRVADELRAERRDAADDAEERKRWQAHLQMVRDSGWAPA